MRNNKITVAFKVMNSKKYYNLPVKVKVAFVNWIDLRFERVGLSYLGSVIEEKCENVVEARKSLKIPEILMAA